MINFTPSAASLSQKQFFSGSRPEWISNRVPKVALCIKFCHLTDFSRIWMWCRKSLKKEESYAGNVFIFSGALSVSALTELKTFVCFISLHGCW